MQTDSFYTVSFFLKIKITLIEIYVIVEYKVTYKDGLTEFRRLSFTEVSVELALVDKVSVVNYLRENLTNV